MEIGNIVNGHVNELLGLNKDLSKERMKVCQKCPLYSPKFGGLCNNKLYIDPNTNDISVNAKDGYVRGCGCRLLAKTALLDARCMIGKW